MGNPYVAHRANPWRAWAAQSGSGYVAITARRQHSFPREAMAVAAEVIARHTQAGVPVTRRLGIGHSIGGHGVIKHAALLGLDQAIAISPYYSPDPALVPENHGLHSITRNLAAADFRGVRIDQYGPPAGTLCWSIFDPADAREAAQGRRVLQVAGVTGLPVQHMGHFANTLLYDAGMLEALFAAQAGDDAGRGVGLLRRAKKTKFRYLARLAADCTRSGHTGWAQALLRRAEQAGFTTQSNEFDTMFRLYLACGEWDRADQMLARTLSRKLVRPLPYLFGAQLRARQHRVGDAWDVLQAGLALFPGDTHLTQFAQTLANHGGQKGELLAAAAPPLAGGEAAILADAGFDAGPGFGAAEHGDADVAAQA